jgi:hypothetical protein
MIASDELLEMTMPHFLRLTALAFVAAPIAAAAETPAAKAPSAEKQICKRSPVTGSLARVVKICGTAADWEAKRRAGKQYLQDIQDRSRSVPCPEGSPGCPG